MAIDWYRISKILNAQRNIKYNVSRYHAENPQLSGRKQRPHQLRPGGFEGLTVWGLSFGMWELTNKTGNQYNSI